MLFTGFTLLINSCLILECPKNTHHIPFRALHNLPWVKGVKIFKYLKVSHRGVTKMILFSFLGSNNPTRMTASYKSPTAGLPRTTTKDHERPQTNRGRPISGYKCTELLSQVPVTVIVSIHQKVFCLFIDEVAVTGLICSFFSHRMFNFFHPMRTDCTAISLQLHK